MRVKVRVSVSIKVRVKHSAIGRTIDLYYHSNVIVLNYRTMVTKWRRYVRKGNL